MKWTHPSIAPYVQIPNLQKILRRPLFRALERLKLHFEILTKKINKCGL